MRASLGLLIALALATGCRTSAAPPIVVAPMGAPTAIVPAPSPPRPEPVAAEASSAPATPLPATEGVAGACADPLAHRRDTIDASDPVKVPPEL